MKTFKIVTECTAITEYLVVASTADEAEEKYVNGEYKHERITDYRDENIDTIDEVKEQGK